MLISIVNFIGESNSFTKPDYILSCCKKLLGINRNYKVNFTLIQTNFVAHTLIKVSKNHNNPTIFIWFQQYFDYGNTISYSL
jgi:hypothetical protein